MLPIIGYGNGDHICLNIRDGHSSKVFIFDHEKNGFTVIGESFSKWLSETDGYE